VNSHEIDAHSGLERAPTGVGQPPPVHSRVITSLMQSATEEHSVGIDRAATTFRWRWPLVMSRHRSCMRGSGSARKGVRCATWGAAGGRGCLSATRAATQPSPSVVVIGAGFIGLEAVEASASADCRSTSSRWPSTSCHRWTPSSRRFWPTSSLRAGSTCI
jgi:hypothetical protein